MKTRKIFFIFIFLLLFGTIIFCLDHRNIQGTVISKLDENTYLILSVDNEKIILISEEELNIHENISIGAVKTQYNPDISKPAYRVYDDSFSVIFQILNISYGLLLMIYLANMALTLRISPKKQGEKDFPHHIKIISGPDSGKMYKISEGRIYTVGRDLSNDIIINDKTVSRKQGKIWIDPKKKCLLYKSFPKTTNLIYINDKVISEKTYKISENDIISMGLSNLMLYIERDDINDEQF